MLALNPNALAQQPWWTEDGDQSEEKRILASNLRLVCSWCLTPDPTSRCSRCKAASYCGSSCQTSAWDGHKKPCKDQSKGLEPRHLPTLKPGALGVPDLGASAPTATGRGSSGPSQGAPAGRGPARGSLGPSMGVAEDSSSFTAAETGTSVEWTCDACTYLNTSDASVPRTLHGCAVCEKRRPLDDPPVRAAVPVVAVVSWVCECCTYENKQGVDLQSVCGTCGAANDQVGSAPVSAGAGVPGNDPVRSPNEASGVASGGSSGGIEESAVEDDSFPDDDESTTEQLSQSGRGDPAKLVGKQVVIHGDHAKTELNGCLGVAETFLPSSSRYSILLDDGRGPFKIKAENLDASSSEVSAATAPPAVDRLQDEKTLTDTCRGQPSDESLGTLATSSSETNDTASTPGAGIVMQGGGDDLAEPAAPDGDEALRIEALETSITLLASKILGTRTVHEALSVGSIKEGVDDLAKTIAASAVISNGLELFQCTDDALARTGLKKGPRVRVTKWIKDIRGKCSDLIGLSVPSALQSAGVLKENISDLAALLLAGGVSDGVDLLLAAEDQLVAMGVKRGPCTKIVRWQESTQLKPPSNASTPQGANSQLDSATTLAAPTKPAPGVQQLGSVNARTNGLVFKDAVKKMLQVVHPALAIGRPCLEAMECLMMDMFVRVVQTAQCHSGLDGAAFDVASLAGALEAMLAGELLRHGVHKAAGAVAILDQNGAGTFDNVAGLHVPISVVSGLLSSAVEISMDQVSTCAAYLCAVLEHMGVEWLGLGGQVATSAGKRQLWPRHILEAIQSNIDLSSAANPELLARVEAISKVAEAEEAKVLEALAAAKAAKESGGIRAAAAQQSTGGSQLEREVLTKALNDANITEGADEVVDILIGGGIFSEAALAASTDDALGKLGMKKGPRIKITKWKTELVAQEVPENLADAAAPSAIVQLLDSMQMKDPTVARLLESYGINSAPALLTVSDESLAELGIKKGPRIKIAAWRERVAPDEGLAKKRAEEEARKGAAEAAKWKLQVEVKRKADAEARRLAEIAAKEKEIEDKKAAEIAAREKKKEDANRIAAEAKARKLAAEEAAKKRAMDEAKKKAEKIAEEAKMLPRPKKRLRQLRMQRQLAKGLPAKRLLLVPNWPKKTWRENWPERKKWLGRKRKRPSGTRRERKQKNSGKRKLRQKQRSRLKMPQHQVSRLPNRPKQHAMLSKLLESCTPSNQPLKSLLLCPLYPFPWPR